VHHVTLAPREHAKLSARRDPGLQTPAARRRIRGLAARAPMRNSASQTICTGLCNPFASEARSAGLTAPDQMKRREFIGLVGCAAIALPRSARAGANAARWRADGTSEDAEVKRWFAASGVTSRVTEDGKHRAQMPKWPFEEGGRPVRPNRRGLGRTEQAPGSKHCVPALDRNPRDRVSGFRVVRLIPGVGAKTATRILIVPRYAIAHQAVRSWKSV